MSDLDRYRCLIATIAEGWAPEEERAELAEFDTFAAEVKRLRLAVALHQPQAHVTCVACDAPHCVEDGSEWPCPTARAAGVEGSDG